MLSASTELPKSAWTWKRRHHLFLMMQNVSRTQGGVEKRSECSSQAVVVELQARGQLIHVSHSLPPKALIELR